MTILELRNVNFHTNVGIAFKKSLNIVQVLTNLIVVNVVNIVQGPKVSKIGSLDDFFARAAYGGA